MTVTKKKTRRIQVDLDPRDFEDLQKLEQRLGASTYAEVVRRSIRFTLRATEVSDKRGTVIFREPDKSEVEIYVI